MTDDLHTSDDSYAAKINSMLENFLRQEVNTLRKLNKQCRHVDFDKVVRMVVGSDEVNQDDFYSQETLSNCSEVVKEILVGQIECYKTYKKELKIRYEKVGYCPDIFNVPNFKKEISIMVDASNNSIPGLTLSVYCNLLKQILMAFAALGMIKKAKRQPAKNN